MSVFGLTFDKLILLTLLAAILIGPSRLPAAAAQLGRWARHARKMIEATKSRVREEMPEEFEDIDWKSLDPRQYDPRRIVQDALFTPTIIQAPPATREEIEAVPGGVAPPDAPTRDQSIVGSSATGEGAAGRAAS